MNRTLVVLLVTMALPAWAAAQEKIKVSGTVECGKADKENTIEVGDSAKHSVKVSQGKCNWTKPMELNGTSTNQDLVTWSSEASGDHIQGSGYAVLTMSNGDKMEVHLQERGSAKEGKMSSDGKWTILHGTGKTKGLKGAGTYKCSGTADKTSCDVKGEYEKAAAPMKQ